jgi:hypothetical protein
MIAVLFTYVPSTGANYATPISWGDNPVAHAEALLESCRDDFPGAIWSIGADEEACKAAGDARMKSLLGPDWTPEP